jgi:uncharacterized protein (TIGR02246 family)
MTNQDQRLAAETEIRALVARYSDAVIRHDANAWGDTWADAAEWHILGSCTSGRDEIVSHWTELMAGIPFVVLFPVFGLVEVSDGDQATGRWYVHELSKRPSRSTLTIGVYHDRYVHEDDAWRFAVRRFDILYTGPPDLSGESFPFPTDV